VTADRRHPGLSQVLSANGVVWALDPDTDTCPCCDATWLRDGRSSFRPIVCTGGDVSGPREIAVCPGCFATAARHGDGDPIGGYGSSMAKVHPIGLLPTGEAKRRGTSTRSFLPDAGYRERLLFGVELEAATPEDLTPERLNRHARIALGEIYCEGKRDGSITPRGVEIVTHPATIGAHRLAWRSWQPPVGAIANDSCGLHIHVSRSALTEGQVDRLAYLVSRRHDLARWSQIFRRRPNNYAKAMPIGSFARRRWRDVASDRYHVLNMSGPHTIELRWPRGTVRGDVVLATVEMLHIACHYVAAGNPGGSHSATALCLDSLLAWIVSDPWARSETTTLRPYLHRRGVLRQAMTRKGSSIDVDDGTDAHTVQGPCLGSETGWATLRAGA
jgi:hypothetical protein